jgi:hypothetical protein
LLFQHVATRTRPVRQGCARRLYPPKASECAVRSNRGFLISANPGRPLRRLIGLIRGLESLLGRMKEGMRRQMLTGDRNPQFYSGKQITRSLIRPPAREQPPGSSRGPCRIALRWPGGASRAAAHRSDRAPGEAPLRHFMPPPPRRIAGPAMPACRARRQPVNKASKLPTSACPKGVRDIRWDQSGATNDVRLQGAREAAEAARCAPLRPLQSAPRHWKLKAAKRS